MTQVWSDLVGAFQWVLDGLYGFTGNYGVAVILITLIIRFAMWPLMHKQIGSMRRMQLLQPEMQKLQKKYKNDKQKLNEEMAKFMRENNANPMTGCLPMLVQLPFLYALYAVLRGHDSGMLGAHFLWISDLSKADPYYILPILSGILTFFQTRMTQPATMEGPAAGTQRTMMYLFPVLIFYITSRLPAALGLYWVTTTSVMILQYWWGFRNITLQPAAAGASTSGTIEVGVAEDPAGRTKGEGPGGGKRKAESGNAKESGRTGAKKKASRARGKRVKRQLGPGGKQK